MGWHERVAGTGGTAVDRGGDPGQATDRFGGIERQLWLLVAVGFAADAGLTLLGLRIGLTEANPVVASLIGTVGPLWGVLAAKVAVLAVAGTVYGLLDRGLRPAVPLAIAVTWLIAAAINCVGLAAAV